MKISMNTVGYVLRKLYHTETLDSLTSALKISKSTCIRFTSIKEKHIPKSPFRTIQESILIPVFHKCKKELYKDDDAKINARIKLILESISADTAQIEPFFSGDFDTLLQKLLLEADAYYSHPDCEEPEEQEAPSPEPQTEDPPVVLDKPVCFCDAAGLHLYGISPASAAEQILENDRKLYGNIGVNSGEKLQWSTHMSRFKKNWGFLISEDNRIVGNYSVTYLTAAQEKRYRSGDLTAEEKTAANSASPYTGEELAVDLMNLSVNPEYASEENYQLLWEKFGGLLLELAKNGTYFHRVYTCLFTPDKQEAFFMKKGFRFQANRKGGGKIYCLDFTYGVPQAFRMYLPALYEEYVSKFGPEDISFGPCPSDDRFTLAQAQQIGSLLYSTDRYIWKAVFHSREDARLLLGELLFLGTDPVFNKRNFYCAFCGDRIIGIIHFLAGPVSWNSKTFHDQAIFTGVTLKDTYIRVEQEYFPSYNREAAEDTMTLLHVCVDPLWADREIRLGSRMMGAFLSEYGAAYDLELHVLQETRAALRLYQKSGFSLVSEEYGFSPDKNKPKCFYMRRPKDKIYG